MKLLKVISTLGLSILTSSAVAQSAPVELKEIAKRLRSGEVITIENRSHPEVRSAGKEMVEVLSDFLLVVETFCKPGTATATKSNNGPINVMCWVK